MVPELRRRHLLSWSVLAFLLPAVFTAAIWVIPSSEMAPNVLAAEEKTLPYQRILNSMEAEGFEWILREKSPGGLRQIEVKALSPVLYPVLLFYFKERLTDDPPARLLGRFEGGQENVFTLDSISSQWEFYHIEWADGIKKKMVGAVVLSEK